jgi:hypothetical protein
MTTTSRRAYAIDDPFRSLESDLRALQIPTHAVSTPPRHSITHAGLCGLTQSTD